MNSRERAETIVKIIKISLNDEEFLINFLAKELEIAAIIGYNRRFDLPESKIPEFDKLLKY